MQNDRIPLLEQALMVMRRLERLSADSIWAHLACGYRGAILRAVDEMEHGSANPAQVDRLEWLVRQGFTLLENAARELAVPEDVD